MSEIQYVKLEFPAIMINAYSTGGPLHTLDGIKKVTARRYIRYVAKEDMDNIMSKEEYDFLMYCARKIMGDPNELAFYLGLRKAVK